MARNGRHFSKKRTGGAPRVLPVLLIVAGVILILGAGGLFVRSQIGYGQAKSEYDALEQYAVSDKGSEGSAAAGAPTVDFDSLAKINPDVVGWICIPGTPINYPVVQTNDNSTYLTRMFSATSNPGGAIFLDKDAKAPGVIDQQTTIYGHHMNDGSMFKAIDGTLDQGTFDSIGRVWYVTRDATYMFRPLFTAQVPDTYEDARTANFTGNETLSSYLQDMLGRAKAKASDAKTRIGSADHVLTLVTCAGDIIPRTTRAAMVCTLEESVPASS